MGHGLLIFLEKLGFCQVPPLQILPGPVGSCPAEARRLFWGLRGITGATAAAESASRPHVGGAWPAGVTKPPSTHPRIPQTQTRRSGRHCVFSPPPTLSFLFSGFVPPAFFLCERSGSDQLVSQGAHPFHPSVSERVPPYGGHGGWTPAEAPWGSCPLFWCLLRQTWAKVIIQKSAPRLAEQGRVQRSAWPEHSLSGPRSAQRPRDAQTRDQKRPGAGTAFRGSAPGTFGHWVTVVPQGPALL